VRDSDVAMTLCVGGNHYLTSNRNMDVVMFTTISGSFRWHR
jgi:hypothetical protein